MLKTCALFSGSSGNSIYISSKRMASVFYGTDAGAGFSPGTSLLVDIGVNGKELESAILAIGESIREIDGILLTHEHVDHMRGIGVVMRRYKIPLFVNQGTWDRMQTLPIGVVPENLVHIIESGNEFTLGDLAIRSFRTPHDAAESVGYRIASGRQSVSIFTDIGEIREDLLANVSGSDTVFIESNYDYEMLWKGPYPWFLKKRIDGANGHLSNADCARAIGALMEKGTSRFVLSHLSKENNSPQIALETSMQFLESMGAKIGADAAIQVARRSEPSEPWTIS